jgi:hypothetical protein
MQARFPNPTIRAESHFPNSTVRAESRFPNPTVRAGLWLFTGRTGLCIFYGRIGFAEELKRGTVASDRRTHEQTHYVNLYIK